MVTLSGTRLFGRLLSRFIHLACVGTVEARTEWHRHAVSGGTVVAIDDKPVLFDSFAQLAGFTLTDSEEPIVSENPDTAAESTHTLYLPIISQEVE